MQSIPLVLVMGAFALLEIPRQILLLQGFAFVMELLALGHCDFKLRVSLRKEKLRGNASLSARLKAGGKFLNFLLVKEELPVSEMINVKDVAFLIGGDMHVPDIGFSVFHKDERIAYRGVPRPKALDFRSGEHQTRHHEVAQKILEMSASVF